jgi:chromosomal replication initiation ATPase DnaA
MGPARVSGDMSPGVGENHREASARAAALSMVAGLVCATYGLALRDLHAPTRLCQRVARARQVAVYLSHVGLGITLSAAASWFGRDPSTASHACRMIENARDETTFDLALARLEGALTHWREASPFDEPLSSQNDTIDMENAR